MATFHEKISNIFLPSAFELKHPYKARFRFDEQLHERK